MADDKPKMPDSLRELAVAAKARVQKLGATAPVTEMIPVADSGGCLVSPYAEEDWELWLCLLLETFGTRSPRVVIAFMRQLTGMIPTVWDGDKQTRILDVELMQLALSIICSLKPKNEAQAAIAVHCVALHLATLKVTEHMGSRSWLDPKTASALAAITKTYTAQVRALHEMQSPSRAKRQIIKVEKNVTVNHYHDEKHVHLPGGGTGASGNQSHASEPLRARATPARSVSERPALPRPDQGGDVLSFPRDEGKEAVPDARLGRRSEGGA